MMQCNRFDGVMSFYDGQLFVFVVILFPIGEPIKIYHSKN